jgi:hypothetical protein
MECITPHIAVDASVSTVLRIPSETSHQFLSGQKLNGISSQSAV